MGAVRIRSCQRHCHALFQVQDARVDLVQACDIETAAVQGQGRDDRGLILTRDVEAKRAVARIPLINVLLVTDEPSEKLSIFGDQHLRRFQEAHGKMPAKLVEFLTNDSRWDVRLTAWLLYLVQTATDGSLWALYKESLPQLEDLNLLMCYTPMEQMMLQVHMLKYEAEIQRDATRLLYNEHLHGAQAELNSLGVAPTFEHALWAFSLVRSRTFGASIDGEEVTIMAPFLDLANHSLGFCSSFRIADDREHFELYSIDGSRRDTELTISYGEDRSNMEFMRDYGFCMPALPEDRVYLIRDLKHFAKTGAGHQPEHDIALEALQSADDLRAADEYRNGYDAADASGSGRTRRQSLWGAFSAQFSQRERSSKSRETARPRRLRCFAVYQALGAPGKACHCAFKVRSGLGDHAQAALRSLMPVIIGTVDDADGDSRLSPSGPLSGMWSVPASSNGAPIKDHELMTASVAARPELQLSRTQRVSELELVESLESLLASFVASWKTSATCDETSLLSGDVSGSRERQAVAARLEYKRVVLGCSDLLTRYRVHLQDGV